MPPEVAPASAPPESTAMRAGKRIALELSIGAVLGFVGWSFVGPTVIGWWYEPPSKDAFSCAGSVRMGVEQFVKLQLGSAIAGAVGLALVTFAIRRIFRPADRPSVG